jgi:hypothetical protein
MSEPCQSFKWKWSCNVASLTNFKPRTSACSYAEFYSVDRARVRVRLRYVDIFTSPNSFWITLARVVTDSFLRRILNVWFEKFSWIFLFWDWDGAQNKRLAWPSKWRWAFWQWVCFWRWVCTCRAVRNQQKTGLVWIKAWLCFGVSSEMK